jgi:hypothetical protein
MNDYLLVTNEKTCPATVPSARLPLQVRIGLREGWGKEMTKPQVMNLRFF